MLTLTSFSQHPASGLGMSAHRLWVRPANWHRPGGWQPGRRRCWRTNISDCKP